MVDKPASIKVAVVSAYNNKVEMTREFLDCMQRFWPPADKKVSSWMILVNGGGPEKICHPFIDIRIDLDANHGFCRTLNAGLEAVPDDADYLFFVGNDSFPVDDGWLPRLIKLLERTDAWMACPANDKPGMRAYRELYRHDYGDHWEVEFFPSIAWLMRVERFKQIGLLDDRYVRTGMYADNDYCRRIVDAGGKIVVSKEILLRHLLSAEGKVLGTQHEDMEVNLRHFEYKWGKG